MSQLIFDKKLTFVLHIADLGRSRMDMNTLLHLVKVLKVLPYKAWEGNMGCFLHICRGTIPRKLGCACFAYKSGRGVHRVSYTLFIMRASVLLLEHFVRCQSRPYILWLMTSDSF